MNLWSRIAVVCRKELVDAFRDRRSVYTILFSALVGPVLVGFMFNRLADKQKQVTDIRIPVVGMAHAPALMEWLRQQGGVEIVAGPGNAEEAVQHQKEEVVVVVPPDFAEHFRSAKPAGVQIVSDGSRTGSRGKVQRIRQLLQRYSAEIGGLRLVARGVSPSIARALDIEEVEVSSAQQRAAVILNFIPLFIVLAAFAGGMQIATDSTAGERERGSLEPLLVNPAPREAFVFGKWLAAVVASLASVLLTMALCVAVLQFIPLQEFGVRFRFSGGDWLVLLAAGLPACPMCAAIQIYLSTFARSFKEAQSYMGMLIMLPMLPGILSSIYQFSNQPWMYPIPILAQHVLLGDTIGGKAPAAWAFGAALASALVVSALLLLLTSRLFRSERIIFGR
jgi:sodium transport system permease protein